MKRFEMVKSYDDFNNIINKGKYIKNNYFVIYILNNESNYPHFGLAVGKKIGNAVKRNKLKRQIRSIIDDNKKFFIKNNDYIIMIKKNADNLKYNDLYKELKNLIKEIKWKNKLN